MPGVDLAVEEVCHRMVVEEDRDATAPLEDQLDVLDVEQVVGRGDAEAAHLGVAQVAQVQKFRPGRGAQPKRYPGGRRSVRIARPQWWLVHGLRIPPLR